MKSSKTGQNRGNRKGKSPAEGQYPHAFKRTFSAFDYKSILSALADHYLEGKKG